MPQASLSLFILALCTTLTKIHTVHYPYSKQSPNAHGAENLGVIMQKFCLRLGLTLYVLSIVFLVPVHSASASACASITPQPISWWPGDGDKDDIIGGHHGTGSATFDTGKVNQGFNFNGSTWVDVPDSPAWTLGGHDFTIELWAKLNSLSGLDPFMAHTNGAGFQNKWIFWYNSTGHDRLQGVPALRFMMYDSSGTAAPHDIVVAPWNPTAGQWYHLAVTRSGDTYKLYINGNPVASDTSSSVIPNPSASLTIGRAEAYKLNGMIDEPAFYSRALTSQEVSQIFNADSTGKCKPTFPVPEYGQLGGIIAFAVGVGGIALVRKRAS